MDQDFTQFGPWQKAMDLAVMIKDATDSFPKEELYGVTSQLRRAALSVTANIAEGFGRYTYPDKMHKYVQARGELTEVMSFLIYCERVGYLSHETLQSLFEACRIVQRLLNALIKKMDSMQ